LWGRDENPRNTFIWETQDGGLNWEIVSEFKEPEIAMREIQFNTPDSWALAGRYLNFTPSKPFILKTENRGKNWTRHYIDKDTAFLKNVSLLYFYNPDTRYAVAFPYGDEPAHYTYRTIDGGVNWERAFLYQGSQIFYSMHFPTACTGYIGGVPYHIFKTTTCGKPVSTEPLAALSLEPEFAVYPCPAPQGKATLAFPCPPAAA
jgi:photosystem II stability/assembly factor-like uncharacterized protein